MKKIELNASMTVSEGFEDFIINKKSSGLTDKTLTLKYFNQVSTSPPLTTQCSKHKIKDMTPSSALMLKPYPFIMYLFFNDSL